MKNENNNPALLFNKTAGSKGNLLKDPSWIVFPLKTFFS